MSIASVLRDAGIPVNDRRKVSMGGGDKRPKSKVTHIARHHSGVNVDQSMSILEGYWKNAHGWKSGGYHVVIHFDGSVDWNYDYDTISNGVGNHNSYIFNISVLGNGHFTSAQEKSWMIICKEVQRELGIPTSRVLGHREFSGHGTNSCPGINMNSVRSALNNGKPVGGTTSSPTPAKPAPKPASGKLDEDGYLGESTISALQRYFGTPVDGVLSQPSPMARKLQELIGTKADGYWQTDTNKALQAFFGTPVDGVISSPSVVIKELQKRLNAGNLGAKKVGSTSTATGSTSTANKPTAKPAVTTETESIAGVQTFLNKWFNGGLNVDGINGPSTKKAIVRAVQTELNRQFKAGLSVDGIWGSSTEAKWATVRKGASGNLTRLIQAILICNGYGVGGFDAKFGGGLYNAVVRYQKNKGLGADGIVGKGTARSMFK